jgi:hypothetical protein
VVIQITTNATTPHWHSCDWPPPWNSCSAIEPHSSPAKHSAWTEAFSHGPAGRTRTTIGNTLSDSSNSAVRTGAYNGVREEC